MADGGAEGGHTRTSTEDGEDGSDFCAECSHAAQDWVKWPCAGAGPPVEESSLLTDEELAVLDLLAEASNRFFRLPEHHPMDAYEWAHTVHALQHRVMCRAAIRAYPDRFTAMVPTTTGDSDD